MTNMLAYACTSSKYLHAHLYIHAGVHKYVTVCVCVCVYPVLNLSYV